jgi:MYND finger protein
VNLTLDMSLTIIKSSSSSMYREMNFLQDPFLLKIFREKFKFDFYQLESNEHLALKVLKKTYKSRHVFFLSNPTQEEEKIEEEYSKKAIIWMNFSEYYYMKVSSRLLLKEKNELNLYNPKIFSARGRIKCFPTQKIKCVCGNPGLKRCSKCKMTYYCSRQCQVEDWKDHKDDCEANISLVSVLSNVNFFFPKEPKTEDEFFIEQLPTDKYVIEEYKPEKIYKFVQVQFKYFKINKIKRNTKIEDVLYKKIPKNYMRINPRKDSFKFIFDYTNILYYRPQFLFCFHIPIRFSEGNFQFILFM